MTIEQAPETGNLVSRTGSRTLLDYGSGRGQAYEEKDSKLAAGTTVLSLNDYLELGEIRCYDPGFEPFSQLPVDRFDE